MRALALLPVLALAACASRPADPLPALPAADPSRSRDDAVVALYNGEPLTWRTVAEKSLELDLKAAVDTYVRWRVTDERRRNLKILHRPDELERRARVFIDEVKARMGAEIFLGRLRADGMGEADYAASLARSDYLSQLLTLDKIVRYQAVVDGSLTIERALFASEADARAFAEAAGAKGFEAAATALKARVLPRESFARTAPPTDPPLDPRRLDGLATGAVAAPEPCRPGLFAVTRLLERRDGRKVRYDEVKAEVLDEILRRPPEPSEYRAWLAKSVAEARIEYAAPRTPGTP